MKQARQEFLARGIQLKIEMGIIFVSLTGVPLASLLVSPVQLIIIFALYEAAYILNQHFDKRRGGK
jgi:hypothetical protein